MRYRTVVGIAAVFLAVAGTASAQDSPLSVNLGGGFTIPYSDSKEAFGTGGNFAFGANFQVAPMIAIQAQYGYNRLGSKDINPSASTLPQGIVTSIPLTANHTIHDGDFNLVIGPPLKDRKAAAYGVFGGGIYHDIVNLTTPAIGVGTVCDPWLYICYPTPVAVDKIIGSRSNNSFGVNFGGGANVKMTDSATFYAEIRYIHTNGPTISNAAGDSVTANGNYWPFTFGFRFHPGN